MNDIIPPASPVQRYLALDKDRGRWVILSQVLPTDEKPADIQGTGSRSRYQDWPETCAWAQAQVEGAGEIQLVPVGYMLVWSIGPGRTP